MKHRWRVTIFAFSTAFALLSGAGFASTAFAVPVTHAAVSSSAIPDNDPLQPPCNSLNDGATWTSPAGINYVCRYVEGAGWRWVPKLVCGGASQTPAGKEQSATC